MGWIKKFLGIEKEEEIIFPSKFAIVRYSKNAKEKGVFDNENKIVQTYAYGMEVGFPKTYSEELVKALEEVDKIPVVEEDLKDERFKFEESADFGNVNFRH